MKRALVALWIAAPLALAQTSERITVEVVNVPVYVTKDSKPVRGLTRDDFELFVNGKRQPFDYFDVIAFTPAAAPRPSNDVLRDRRLFLLTFDLAFTSPAITLRAVRAAEALVERANASDVFAVATLSPRLGVQFIIPFTSDRPLIRRALHSLHPETNHDPLGIVMPALERREWLRAGDVNVAASAREEKSGLGGDGEVATVDVPIDLRQQPLRNLMDFDIQELAAISDRLSGLEGYRHVVVFSEGFNGALLHGAPVHGEKAGPLDPRLLEDMQQLHHHYQVAGAFLDAIDVAGLRNTFNPFENESLLMISLATGGQFVHNRNDLAGALTDLASSQQVVYLLGFKPAETKKKMNAIDVRVKNAPRGTTLSYRHGFATSMPETSIDTLQLADIIMNDTPQSGLAATLTPIANGVSVAVPQSDATVMLYVFDSKGGIVDYRERTNALRFDESFKLPPGDYVAKALLRIGNSLGFSRVAFAIQ